MVDSGTFVNNAIETMIDDIGSFDNAKLPDYLSTGRNYPRSDHTNWWLQKIK